MEALHWAAPPPHSGREKPIEATDAVPDVVSPTSFTLMAHSSEFRSLPVRLTLLSGRRSLLNSEERCAENVCLFLKPHTGTK